MVNPGMISLMPGLLAPDKKAFSMSPSQVPITLIPVEVAGS